MEEVSCGAQWHSLPGHLKQVFQVCPMCGFCVSFWCSQVLFSVGMSMGGMGSQADYEDWP